MSSKTTIKSIRYTAEDQESLDLAIKKFRKEEGIEGEGTFIKWFTHKYQMGHFDPKSTVTTEDETKKEPEYSDWEKSELQKYNDTLDKLRRGEGMCPVHAFRDPKTCDCINDGKAEERLRKFHSISYMFK